MAVKDLLLDLLTGDADSSILLVCDDAFLLSWSALGTEKLARHRY